MHVMHEYNGNNLQGTNRGDPHTCVTVQWTQWIVLLPLTREDGVAKPDRSWPWAGLWQLSHRATMVESQQSLDEVDHTHAELQQVRAVWPHARRMVLCGHICNSWHWMPIAA